MIRAASEFGNSFIGGAIWELLMLLLFETGDCKVELNWPNVAGGCVAVVGFVRR